MSLPPIFPSNALYAYTAFILDLYKMCHFAYFSSVEACLPGNTVLKLYLTMYA